MGETMISRSHLVSGLAERLGIREKICQDVMTTIVEGMENALIEGNRIEIRGFGSFCLKYRPARNGRNPMSGESVYVSPRYVVHFRAGKAMRETVDFQRIVDEKNRSE